MRRGEIRAYFLYVSHLFPRSFTRERPRDVVAREISLYIIVDAFQFNGNGDDTRYRRNFLIPRFRVDRTHLPTLSPMKEKMFNFSTWKERYWILICRSLNFFGISPILNLRSDDGKLKGRSLLDEEQGFF